MIQQQYQDQQESKKDKSSFKDYSYFYRKSKKKKQKKEMKEKINECDLVKNFYTLEKIIVKIKIQPNEWEKIFANNMTIMELIFSIYKQFI